MNIFLIRPLSALFVQQRTFSSSLCKKKQFSARPLFPFQVLIFPAGVAVPAHPSNFSSFRAHSPFPALLLLLSRPPPKKITRYTPSWLSLLHTSTDSSRLFLSSTYIPLPGEKDTITYSPSLATAAAILLASSSQLTRTSLRVYAHDAAGGKREK